MYLVAIVLDYIIRTMTVSKVTSNKLLDCKDNYLHVSTLRTGDADMRFFITTVQDG